MRKKKKKIQSDTLLCPTLPLDTQLAWVWCCLVNMPGVSWGCITNTINWMAYRQQKFISQYSGCWKSQVRVPHGQVLVRTLLWAADGWLLIVSSEASPPNTNCLQRLRLFIPLIVGGRFSTMNLGGDTSIQCMTMGLFWKLTGASNRDSKWPGAGLILI